MANLIDNFWYVTCMGDYADGIYFPFNSRDSAIEYIKQKINNDKIKFEGIDEYGDYVINISTNDVFGIYVIRQRKDNEIISERYIQ